MVKGGTELPQDPVAQELLNSKIPVRLAYNRTDGTPRVVSIWFHWDGTAIVMGTLPGAPKLKALQSGDRVALTIDTNDPPHHSLSIRGTAEVTQTKGVVKEYAQAAARYLGKEQVRPMSGRCRQTSGWAASPCGPIMWWSWTLRPASRAR